MLQSKEQNLILFRSSSHVVATVDIYDVNTGLWNFTTGQLSVARFAAVAAGIGNKVVVAGGVYVILLFSFH